MFFSPLQLDNTLNYDPHKYFLNFPMAHITADDSPKNIYLDFSSGDTVDTETKEIGRRWITSRDLSNSQFPPEFYCDSKFIASTE